MPHGDRSGMAPNGTVSLVLFAVVINALDPSYQAFYTTFSHLVTLVGLDSVALDLEAS